MLKEIYDITITMLLDAIEMFFSVLVTPTPKILKTAFFICFCILGFSIAGYYFEFVTFANWYECLVAIGMIGVLWLISVLNENSINKFKGTLSDIKTNIKRKERKTNGRNK